MAFRDYIDSDSVTDDYYVDLILRNYNGDLSLDFTKTKASKWSNALMDSSVQNDGPNLRDILSEMNLSAIKEVKQSLEQSYAHRLRAPWLATMLRVNSALFGCLVTMNAGWVSAAPSSVYVLYYLRGKRSLEQKSLY